MASSPSASTTVTLPLGQTRAAFAPATLNPATREVEVVWTTGARVRREGWEGPWLEELSLDEGAVDLTRLNGGANLLAGHSAWGLKGIIGVVESAWLTSRPDGRREGRARIRLSGEEEDSSVVRKIADGIIRHVSVGYITHRLEEVDAGDRREKAPPVYRATRWEPVELSFCAVPADAGAGVRSSNVGDGAGEYPCRVTRRKVMDDPTAVDERRPKTRIRTRAEERPAPPPDDDDDAGDAPPPPPPPPEKPEADAAGPVAAAERATAAERERVARILHAVRAAKLPEAFADQHIRSGASELEAQRAVFAEMARTQAPVSRSVVEHAGGDRTLVGLDIPDVRDTTGQKPHRIEVVGGGTDRIGAGIIAALLQRTNPNRFGLTPEGREWIGRSMMELGRTLCERRGLRTGGLGKMELAAVALGLAHAPMRREGPHGFLSTSDFPTLLATVGHATLVAGYGGAPKTYPPWTRQGTLPDFRVTSRISLGTGPKLLPVPEHAEYTRGKLAAVGQPAQLGKWGRILAFTREAMINDDVGLFSRIPQLFGNAAAQVEGDAVYGLLTSNPLMADGFALFSTQHANLMTADTINVKSVGLARSAMLNQKSADGQYLGIVPQFMITGPAQEVYMLQFLSPLTIAGAVANIVPGEYQSMRPIVDPRITDNAWYLAASPDQVDTIEYNYLEGGTAGPVMETREGWDIEGMEFKGRMEFGAAVIDWRGLVKNPGTLPAILMGDAQSAPPTSTRRERE